ncbi:hypothetical protein MJD09_09510, partial [bacterium]|nr:hypothetical protein [bacterium]
GNAGLKRTETELGFGIEGALDTQWDLSGTSIYAVGGYNRFFFDGGRDDLFRLGVQARRNLNVQAGRLWVGGEVSWIRDTSVYDNDLFADNPTSNGFMLGGLAGYAIKLGTLDASLYGGLSLVHFGDFKSDGNVIDSSGNSTWFRAGLEVQLPFGKK